MARIDPEKFVQILEEMRQLLLRYELWGQVDMAAGLIDEARLDSEAFFDHLRSGIVWGSAGSLIDTGFRNNVPGSLTELRDADLRYLALFVNLGDEMRSQGILSEDQAEIIELKRQVLKREGI